MRAIAEDLAAKVSVAAVNQTNFIPINLIVVGGAATFFVMGGASIATSTRSWPA